MAHPTGMVGPYLRAEQEKANTVSSTTTTTQVSPTEAEAKEPKRVKIEGVRIRKVSTTHPTLIPSEDPNYEWPSWTKDALLDILDAGDVIEGHEASSVTHALMFIGHAGSGKTSWPEQVAARIGQPCLVVNFNGQMTVSELIGFNTARAGQVTWTDGVLPFCMRHGIWIVLDEFGYGGNDLRSPLHGVLSPKALLLLLENEHEIVKPHSNFRIFATSNALGSRAKYRSIYPGENLLNAATLSRFSVYEVNYLHPDAEARVLTAKVPKVTAEQAAQMVKVANLTRDALEKDNFSHPFSIRELLAWGNRVARGKAMSLAAADAIRPKVSQEDWKTFEGILQRVLPSK